MHCLERRNLFSLKVGSTTNSRFHEQGMSLRLHICSACSIFGELLTSQYRVQKSQRISFFQFNLRHSFVGFLLQPERLSPPVALRTTRSKLSSSLLLCPKNPLKSFPSNPPSPELPTPNWWKHASSSAKLFFSIYNMYKSILYSYSKS